MTTTVQSICKLNDKAKCRALTGTVGDLNLNGKTIIIDNGITINSTGQSFRFYNGSDDSMGDGKIDVNGGMVSINGSANSLLQIKDLDFDLASGVLGTTTYVSVYDSICTYVTSKMSASDGTSVNAGGTNTGWDFGSTVVAAIKYGVNLFKSKLFYSNMMK